MKNVFYPTQGNVPLPNKDVGAIAALRSSVLLDNETRKKTNITVLSLYGEKEKKVNEKNKYTHYVYIKVPGIIRIIQRVLEFFFSRIPKLKFLQKNKIVQSIYFVFVSAKYMQNNQYDQIVIDGIPSLMWTLALFGNWKRYYKKVCFVGHNEVHHFCRSEKLFVCCNKLVGVSDYIAQYFANRVRLNGQCDVLSIKNPVDPVCLIENQQVAQKYYNDVLDKYDIKEKKIILYVGRVVEDKGVEELFNAVQRLDRDVVLIICGGSFFKNAQKETFINNLEMKAAKAKKRTIFTGYIDHDELKKYYAAADVLVMPSKCNEAAGLVAIEALCNGVPVIASDIGGVREYLEEKASILVSTENLEDNLVKALEDILFDKTLKNLAIAQMDLCRKMFSTDRYCEEYQAKVYGG